MIMKSWKNPALFCLVMISAGWSADAGRYPIRQIDRSLVPPKHMWQEVLLQNTVMHIEDESIYVDEDVIAGFLPLLPSLSMTDNLQWTFLPAPMFKYLLTQNNSAAGNGSSVKEFGLAVEGGLSALQFSPKGADFLYSLGLTAKKPTLDWLWLEGKVHSFYHDLSLQSLIASGGLGFQFSERMYSTATYSLTHMFEDGYRIYHGGAVALGTNFNRNISLELKASAVIGSKALTLNPGAHLAFNW